MLIVEHEKKLINLRARLHGCSGQRDYLGHVKQKSAFAYVQNMQIHVILHMWKFSSIHLFTTKNSIVSNDSIQPRPSSDCTFMHSDLGICCLHMTQRYIFAWWLFLFFFYMLLSLLLFFQPFALEAYKSKEEKLELLDTAIKTHDGNAIIAVSYQDPVVQSII